MVEPHLIALQCTNAAVNIIWLTGSARVMGSGMGVHKDMIITVSSYNYIDCIHIIYKYIIYIYIYINIYIYIP